MHVGRFQAKLRDVEKKRGKIRRKRDKKRLRMIFLNGKSKSIQKQKLKLRCEIYLQFKSLFSLIPQLNLKGLPLVTVSVQCAPAITFCHRHKSTRMPIENPYEKKKWQSEQVFL